MFVVSTYSRRKGGHVVALDLMVALVGARLSANGWRSRVNAAFAGYLA